MEVKVWSCFVLATLFFGIVSGNAFERDLEFTRNREIRPNHGVVFQPLNKKLLVASSVYDLMFAIKRPEWKPFRSCADNKRDSAFLSFCLALDCEELQQYEYLIKDINEAVEAIDHMLRSPIELDNLNSTRRAREPMLGFVGKLSRGLFGTATTGDVALLAAKMNQAISKINKHTEATDDQFNILQSALNHSSAAITNLQKGLMLNFNMVTELAEWQNETTAILKNQSIVIHGLATQMRDYQYFIEEVVVRKLIMFDKLQQVALLAENYLNAISQLNRGYLSPHLVPPKDLKQDLKRVQRALNQDFNGHRVVHTDLTYYYNGHHLASYTYTKQHIIIHVQVPFALESSMFDIYSVHSFPVPLTPGQAESEGYTTFPDLVHYIAVSSDATRYVEMQRSDMALCHQKRITICPEVQVIRRRPAMTCTAGIFFQDSDDTLTLCNPKIFPFSKIATNVQSIGQNDFLITTDVKQYELSCKGQSIQRFPCLPYQVVNVPCACTLHVGSVTVTPSLSSCLEMKSKVKVSHPINYALFLSFDFKPRQFSPIKLSNTSVQLDVPDIRKYVKEFKDIDREMTEEGLSLNKVVEAVKEARNTYHATSYDMDEDLTYLPVISESNFIGVFTILSIILFCVTGVVILLIAIKIRKMDLVIMGLMVANDRLSKLMPTAEAVRLTKVDPTTPTTPTEEPYQVPAIFQYIFYSVLVWCGIVLIRYGINASAKLVGYVRRYVLEKLYGTAADLTPTAIGMLLIDMVSDSCTIVQLRKIPVPRELISGCHPINCTAIMRVNRMMSHVDILWDVPLSVMIRDIRLDFWLPKRLTIAPLQVRTVAKIFSQPQNLKLMLVLDHPLQYLAQVTRSFSDFAAIQHPHTYDSILSHDPEVHGPEDSRPVCEPEITPTVQPLLGDQVTTIPDLHEVTQTKLTVPTVMPKEGASRMARSIPDRDIEVTKVIDQAPPKPIRQNGGAGEVGLNSALTYSLSAIPSFTR